LRGLQSGSVVLAVGEGFIDGLSEPLARFSTLYPKVELQVNVCGTNEVIRQVVEDEAHIGLAFNPPTDPKIRSHAHQKQPVCVAVSPDHPLAQIEAPLPLKGLDTYRLGLLGFSYGIRQILTQAEQQSGVSLIPTLKPAG
jgi:DNA-binding transcriptional LysR family regulator